MKRLFQNESVSYAKRVFRGLIINLVLIWTFLLVWYFTFMPENQKQISIIVISILSIYLAISTIPKLRYLLISIIYSDKSYIITFMDYNQIKQVLILEGELNIELKYVRERSITNKLSFYIEDKLLFSIFARKQNEKYNNKIFKALYDEIIKLKSKKDCI